MGCEFVIHTHIIMVLKVAVELLFMCRTVSYESRLQYAVGDHDDRSQSLTGGASPIFSRKVTRESNMR